MATDMAIGLKTPGKPADTASPLDPSIEGTRDTCLAPGQPTDHAAHLSGSPAVARPDHLHRLELSGKRRLIADCLENAHVPDPAVRGIERKKRQHQREQHERRDTRVA